MERLTEIDEFGNADVIGCSSEQFYYELTFEELNSMTRALNKLSAYEDTGYSPEEIKHIKLAISHNTRLVSEVEKLKGEVQNEKQNTN